MFNDLSLLFQSFIFLRIGYVDLVLNTKSKQEDLVRKIPITKTANTFFLIFNSQ